MMCEPRFYAPGRRGCARHSFSFAGCYLLPELVDLYALLLLVAVLLFCSVMLSNTRLIYDGFLWIVQLIVIGVCCAGMSVV